MPDKHPNFAVSTVAVAPVSATAGTSLGVQTGDGTQFSGFPFNAVVCPAGVLPSRTNAEIIRITGQSGDTLTILRGPQTGDPGGINRSIVVGDQIFVGETGKALTDIEDVLNASAYRAAVAQDNPISHWRFGEKPGAIFAYDQQNANHGSYVDTGANRVGNPGFETDTSGWSTTASAYWVNSGATLTRVTAQAHSGAAAGQIVTTAASASQGAMYALPGVCLAGVPYTVSLWYKGNAGGESLQLVFGAPLNVEVSATPTINATTGWQQVTATITFGQDQPVVYVGIRSAVAAAYTFFIDDVSVTGAGHRLGSSGALVNDPNAAVGLDGATGYVSVPDAPSLRITGDITLEAWVRPAANNTGRGMTVISKDSVSGAAAPYELALSNYFPVFYAGNGTTASSVTATTALVVGVWSHVAAAVSGTNVALYVNGQLAGTGSIAGATRTDTGAALLIGSEPVSWQYMGAIDEVAVYNYTLPAVRLAAHYAAARPSWNRGVRVSPSVNGSIPNNAWTSVGFDTETYKDEAGMHSTTTNPTRLTCVTPGRYMIFGSLLWTLNASGARVARILYNGGTELTRHNLPAASATEGDSNSPVTVYNLLAGDYVELQAYQDSGGALNYYGDAGVLGVTNFGMERISG